MKSVRHQIDTVQATDCYDPADYIMVHKDYLTRLMATAGQKPEIVSKPREVTHAYELEM